MFDVKLLFFLRNSVRIEGCTEEFVQMHNYLSARPAAQCVEELFRDLASVFLNSVCPGGIMYRHGIGEGAIAVKNITGIPSFGWRKQRHRKARGYLHGFEPSTTGSKACNRKFLLILGAFPG